MARKVVAAARERACERCAADAVAGRAEQVGQLVERGEADDRSREQEAVAGGVLVGVGRRAGRRPSSRRSGRCRGSALPPARCPTAIAWRQLSRAIRSSLWATSSPKTGALRRRRSKASSSTPLRIRKAAADGGRGEERAQRVLEQQAEDAGRDGADDQQPAQARVGVVGARSRGRAASASSPATIRTPVVAEEPEQHERGGEVRRDQEGRGSSRRSGGCPSRSSRGRITRVAQARDREGLGDALQQAQDDGLEVGDRVHRGEATVAFMKRP